MATGWVEGEHFAPFGLMQNFICGMGEVCVKEEDLLVCSYLAKCGAKIGVSGTQPQLGQKRNPYPHQK